MSSRAPDLLAISSGGLTSLGSARGWLDAIGRAGVDAVQLREKTIEDRRLEIYARVAMDTLPGDVALLVNGRADVALAAGAAGVHLPSNGLPTHAVRRLLGAERCLGRSTHRLEEVEQAFAEGADYVTFGPVFSTPSKLSYGPPVGLEALAEAAGRGRHVIALGGITMENAGHCIEAGAHGIAGISLFADTDDLARRVARLRGLLRYAID